MFLGHCETCYSVCSTQTLQHATTFDCILHPMNMGVEVTWYFMYHKLPGARGDVVVKALRYKPAGHGFYSR
jgi:hypothetical protein